MRICRVVLPALLVVFATVRLAGADDSPATRPSIPALVVGSTPPAAFVVDGFFHFNVHDSFGVHVATDGKQCITVVYDANDGTPIFYSDGKQTLVYDLMGDRIIRLTDASTIFTFTVDPDDDSFKFNWNVQSADAKGQTKFRVDQFMALSKHLRLVKSDKNSLTYAELGHNGGIAAVQVSAGQLHWFRFLVSMPPNKTYSLDLTASIGEPTPADLRFPDSSALDKALKTHQKDEVGSLAIITQVMTAPIARMIAHGTPAQQAKADEMFGHPDWKKLAQDDSDLSKLYLSALMAQGISFSNPAPAASPASR